MKEQTEKSRVLFYRRLINKDAGSNGGNLKLRDCFDHISNSPQYTPEIYFSKDTIWYPNAGNYWSTLKSTALDKWEMRPGDVLFFSGADWLALPEHQRKHPPVPVVNIVQPRHTRPNDKRNTFLQYPAIRIAKSKNGAEILRNHGVNGPLYLVPDTIDLSLMPPIPENKDIDVLILGLKQPQFAQRVFDLLQAWSSEHGRPLNIKVQLPPKLPTRQDFLQLLSRAKIAACIPLEASRGAEGFYLPALEAMALKCLVVCPHAIGNVDHCQDGVNCLVPDYTPEAVFSGVLKALDMEEQEKQNLIQNGLLTADEHRIEHERKAILDIVHNAYSLWDQKDLFNFNATKSSQSRETFRKKVKRYWNRLLGKQSALEGNNLLLTGIPRSGTTLSSFLLSQLPDTVVLNEPLEDGKYQSGIQAVKDIQTFFKKTRHSLLTEQTAIARVVNGKMTDNNFSLESGRKRIVVKDKIKIEKNLNPDFTLGLKHTSTFTLLLEMLQQEFSLFAIIRNPLATLGSWNSVGIPVGRGIVRNADIFAPKLAKQLVAIDDLGEKQLHILDWYFTQYLQLPKTSILKYEDIITTGGSALRQIVPSAAQLNKKLENKNISQLYDSDFMKAMGEKLLKRDHACWQFYAKQEVEDLIKV